MTNFPGNREVKYEDMPGKIVIKSVSARQRPRRPG